MLVNVFFPWSIPAQPEIWELYRALARRAEQSAGGNGHRATFRDGHAARDLLKSAAIQQGLLQIYEDFCMQDESDCAACLFPAAGRRLARVSATAIPAAGAARPSPVRAATPATAPLIPPSGRRLSARFARRYCSRRISPRARRHLVEIDKLPVRHIRAVHSRGNRAPPARHPGRRHGSNSASGAHCRKHTASGPCGMGRHPPTARSNLVAKPNRDPAALADGFARAL